MTANATMTPFRPHLLRAFYDWLVANGLTPHLVVDAEYPGVKVPRQYVKDGQIVLNINPSAVGNLQLGDLEISFSARFGGSPFAVRVPIGAANAIYARENGAGTVFNEEPALAATSEVVAAAQAESGPDDEPPPPRGASHLKVVK